MLADSPGRAATDLAVASQEAGAVCAKEDAYAS